MDDSIGIPLATETIIADDEADLVAQILQICDEKDIDLIVLGLPLLPTGKEGAQTSFVRLIGDRLEAATMPVEFLDERYTTDKQAEGDGDAKAAIQLLTTFLERGEKSEDEDDVES